MDKRTHASAAHIPASQHKLAETGSRKFHEKFQNVCYLKTSSII